jgi:uncharacterized protein
MTFRRRLIRILLILLLLPPILAALAGWLVAPGFLHPILSPLSSTDAKITDNTFSFVAAHREDFDVRAPDGVLLKGWKVRPQNPNRSWVLVFHGVADNRMGVIEHACMLLKSGYSVVMMDARAHGSSGGSLATYGWLERNDTRAIIDTLLLSEHVGAGLASLVPATPPFHLFALGESMGAGIALQYAAADPRIEAVVAEASFATLCEASYDYAGLRRSPLLGKTLLAPFSWTLLYRGEKLAGLPVAEVSPMKVAASRAFPVLLICDANDEALPCRHTKMIYDAAIGPKQMWVVPGAFHTAALGYQPAEFRQRVLAFLADAASKPINSSAK